MKALSILIIGGMHGNEELGVDLVKLLRAKPLPGVTSLIANPRAVSVSQRFTEADLNRSFGVQSLESYESKRAEYIQQYVSQFDLVLDFHNTQTPGNNCAFVGIECNKYLFEVVKNLGLRNCVEATYDCINKYCPNVVSIEISKGDYLDDAKYWYDAIKTLNFESVKSDGALTVFRFKQRVTWQQKRQLILTNWQPFKPISTEVKTKLGLDGIIVPIFVGSKLTEYYATLLTKERTL